METRKPFRGFTLLECMVALAILSIGMAGVGAMLLSSYESDRYNAMMRRSEAIGSKVFEKFRSGNTGTGSAADPCQRPLPPSGTAAYNNETCIDTSKTTGTFYLKWTTTSDPSGLKLLDIIIGWDGPNCGLADPTKCLRQVKMSSIYQ